VTKYSALELPAFSLSFMSLFPSFPASFLRPLFSLFLLVQIQQETARVYYESIKREPKIRARNVSKAPKNRLSKNKKIEHIFRCSAFAVLLGAEESERELATGKRGKEA